MKAKISIESITEQTVSVPPQPIIAKDGKLSYATVKKTKQELKTHGYQVIIRATAEEDPNIIIGEKKLYVKDGTEEQMKKSLKDEATAWWHEIKEIGNRKEKMQILFQNTLDEVMTEL